MATRKKAKKSATVAKTPKRSNASTRTTLKIKATGTTAPATSTTTPLPYSVVYIHGIGKQEAPAALKANWDMALFGQTMTETAMAYWADIRHPQKTGAVGVQSLARPDKALASDQAQQFMAALQDKLRPRAGAVHARGEYRGEVFGLFPGIGDALFKWLSKDFIKDTAAYFFDPAQKKAMQQRLIDVLDQHADKPVVLVAHSQGTIIAYDVLRKLNGRTPSGQKLQIPLFVTMGSPLGIDEVQRKLTQPLQVPGGVAAWANFADLLDPVALDKRLAGEFRGEVVIHDTLVRNPVFGNPHSAVGYLSTAPVRSSVYGVLGWNQMRFGARVRKDVLADLVQSIGAHELDDGPIAPERHCVLFELRDVAAFGESARDGMHTSAKLKSLDQHRDMVVAWLEHNVQDREAARIDPLKRFVAARLTASELHAAEAECRFSVYCIWKNTRKRALILRSGKVIQVPAARTTYQAEGDGITWAVLDTGVESSHPHFRAHDTIAQVWDCTHPGAVRSLLDGKKRSTDAEGHGTHVCGIIAGEHGDYRGMAPKAKLHVYKVLDDAGAGEDSWIIKAIDHIAQINNDSSELAIHGINLSLGGSFDPEVYGCGHSPICQELGRLWRQGLVVCIACGNEGVVDVSTPGGTQTLNTALSIGDPANLEDSLAVGSVHADRPHTYGISFFSSHGPTADGRSKPDVVAPGERITSCNAHYNARDPASLYVSLSGTSMAAPHISGLVAAFLSIRREFVGRPDEVKKILVSNCTDLARDKYLQGAGMPNLMKMLANT